MFLENNADQTAAPTDIAQTPVPTNLPSTSAPVQDATAPEFKSVSDLPWNQPKQAATPEFKSVADLPWNKNGLAPSPFLTAGTDVANNVYTAAGNVAQAAMSVAGEHMYAAFKKGESPLPTPADIVSAIPKIMYEGTGSAIESAEQGIAQVAAPFLSQQSQQKLEQAKLLNYFPVRDAIMAHGGPKNDDEKLQIWSEAALKPFPIVNTAFGGLFAPVTPAFNAAVEIAQKDGVSAGNLALANVVMTVTGLAAAHGSGVPKEAITDFIADHGTAPDVANGSRDATSAETLTAEMAKQAAKAYQKTAELVPEQTPPTLNELARQQSPEIYEAGKVTDAIKAASDRQDLLTRHIDNLKDETKPHSDEDLAAKQEQIDNADNARKAKKYQQQLEDMHDENAAHMKDAASPEIDAARKEIEDLDEKKADLNTSASRRAARAKAEAAAGETHFTQDEHPISDGEWQQLKDAGKVQLDENGKEYVKASDYWSEKTARQDALKEKLTPQEPLTVQKYVDDYIAGEGRDSLAHQQFAANNAEAIEKEFQERQQVAPSGKPIEEQHAAIAGDISKKAQAAGIPKEQADAGAVLQAKGIYGFFARMFGESAETFYAKHGAQFLAVDKNLKTKKGEYSNGVISLLRGADVSTMMHEGAHHFLALMDKFSKLPDAPKALLDEMKIVRDWLKLRDTDDLTNIKENRRAHEQFARGFEQYLKKGIAPSTELLPIFAKMKQWFTEIYDAAKKKILYQKGEFKLTDKARAFFDRTLSEKPEPQIEAKAPAPASAATHEAEAAHTPLGKAAEVADKIAADIQKTAETHDPEVANAIRPAEPTDANPARSAEPTPDNAANGSTAGRATEQANPPQEPDKVAKGGDTSEAKGATDDESGKPTSLTEPKPAESRYVDKVGNIRLDKLIFSDDFINVIKEIAEKNADFMHERYGEPAYQHALRIEAVNELLIQLDVETGNVAKEIENATTPEAKAKAIAKNVQLMDQVVNALKLKNTQSADWAHAGHALQKVFQTVKSGALENIEALLQKETGKTLFQLEQEAKGMQLLETPQLRQNYAKKMSEHRQTPPFAGYVTVNVLSNIVSHTQYGISNVITKLMDIPRIAVEAGYSAKTAAEKVTLREIPEYIYGAYSGVVDTLPATWNAIKTGVTFMEGGNVGLKIYDAMGHMFETTKELPIKKSDRAQKLFDKGEITQEQLDKAKAVEAASIKNNELMENAKAEVKAHGLKREDVNSRLVLPLRESNTAEALAEKAKYPNVYKYLEQAAEPMAHTPMVKFEGPILSKLNPALSGTEKMLAGLHTFLYSMNLGSELARTGYRAGIAQGLEGDKLQGFIDQYKQDPPVEDLMDAHYKALHDQYQTPANYKSFMGKLTLLANHNGLTKALFPVVKMPMEILYQGLVEYSPLAYVSKLATDKINADLRGDNGAVARNAQRAKILTGAGIATMLYGLAYEGVITPDYSSDPETRAQQMAQNYVPHALRVGGAYIPLPKFFGRYGVVASLMADFYHIAFDLDPREQDKIGKAIALAIATDITDETYLGSASNMLQAFRDPAHLPRYLANEFMSAVVPYGSLQSQINTYTNPYMREARDMIDIAKSRTTGVSRTLPLEYDVWGQPLKSGGRNSIRIANDDPISQWVTSLGIGIANAPHRIEGVDLTSEQASEYQRVKGLLSRQMVGQQLDMGLQSKPRQEQFMRLQAALKAADHMAKIKIQGEFPDLIPKINQSRRDIKTGAKYASPEDNVEATPEAVPSNESE